MPKIMVIDQDDDFLSFFKVALNKIHNSQVETYNNTGEALKAAEKQIFDVVISDFRMPDADGMRFFKQLRHLQPDAVRIMAGMLCRRDAWSAANDEQSGGQVVSKPQHLESVCRMVKATLAENALAVA